MPHEHLNLMLDRYFTQCDLCALLPRPIVKVSDSRALHARASSLELLLFKPSCWITRPFQALLWMVIAHFFFLQRIAKLVHVYVEKQLAGALKFLIWFCLTLTYLVYLILVTLKFTYAKKCIVSTAKAPFCHQAIYLKYHIKFPYALSNDPQTIANPQYTGLYHKLLFSSYKGRVLSKHRSHLVQGRSHLRWGVWKRKWHTQVTKVTK